MIVTSVEHDRARDAGDLIERIAGGAADAVALAAADLAADARDRVHELRASVRPLPSELADSIAVTAMGLQAEVRASAGHAAAVEFGTRTMVARPFLGPAAEFLRGTLAARLAAHLRAVIRGL